MSPSPSPEAAPVRGVGPEPRWLSVDEQLSWRAFIDAIRLFTAEIDRELQRESGLNHAYYQILVTLSEAPERTMRMSELAAMTLTSRSRLSHAVARLEEAGWVERRSCPSDKRGSFAVMTDAGFAALESAARGHVEAVRRNLFDILSAGQVRELGAISAVLRDALRSGPAGRCLRAEQAEQAEVDFDDGGAGCEEPAPAEGAEETGPPGGAPLAFGPR